MPQAHEFDAVVPVSARTGEGLNDFPESEVDKYAIEGPQLFPDDMVSDQPERQLVAEIVREKMLRLLRPRSAARRCRRHRALA